MEPLHLGTIDVVLYQDGPVWIAQGIQFDITARGKNPQEATERFNWKVGAELVISYEVGDDSPLAGVPAAPQKFWDMFENAKMRVDVDDMPIRVIDGKSPLSFLKPRIKLSPELSAA